MIDEVAPHIHGPEGYRTIEDETLYVASRLYPWGDKRHRCYVHLYYNAYIRAAAVDRFNAELVQYKKELESNACVEEHTQAYETFFIVKTTPKRGKHVSFNHEAIQKHINQYAGFQVLLTDTIKDPVEALLVYRNKDVVEKCFDDLKNQLDMKRLRMHSAEAVYGRLFVQFIALILMSGLRQEMRGCGLSETYTARELLQEMMTLTKIHYTGRYGHILTELTKPQRDILQKLNIQLPQG